MFLAGLKFGIGFFVGMSGTVAIVMGLVAMATWFKRWWVRESKRYRQEMTDEVELRKEMVERAEHTIARHEKVLFLLRYPSQAGQHTESFRRRTEYIQ
jgi:hypothetical protein